MELLNSVHHITFITADMDRLIAFYERVFEARVIVDVEEDGLRHTFIEVGSHTVLHPFQIPSVEPPGSQPMFQRGRLDHFAFHAASMEAFRELHRRVVAEGANEGVGVVTDMGALGFHSAHSTLLVQEQFYKMVGSRARTLGSIAFFDQEEAPTAVIAIGTQNPNSNM